MLDREVGDGQGCPAPSVRNILSLFCAQLPSSALLGLPYANNPGEGKENGNPVSLPGKSHGQRPGGLPSTGSQRAGHN